ncbi:Fic/DOC family protein [Hymenobacter sp. B81]|uniref:Fic/DOC family protein n=1 Tax=Hymenobacter sp. B81 TaxID=3344878 RepID=UPI0037DD25C9
MDGFLDLQHSTPEQPLLRNKLGLTDPRELREAEGRNIGAMVLVVEGIRPVPGDFDAAHLKTIHRALFQNIYEWAGETRAWGQFQGVKALSGNPMFYAPYEQLDTRLDAIGSQLRQENLLRGLSREPFVDRLAYYADQYNYVHAFREGNGRVLQAVLAEIGRSAGYEVRLTPAQLAGNDYNAYNLARNAGIHRDQWPSEQNLNPLRALLLDATTEAAGEQAQLLRHPSQARLLAEPVPVLQHSEALRTLTTIGRELGAEVMEAELARHQFRPAYREPARALGQGFLDTTLAVLREPVSWSEHRSGMLATVQQLTQTAGAGLTAAALRQLQQQTQAFMGAALVLDANQALSFPFRERELPAPVLGQLGQPLDRLWMGGHMEKLLKGERSGQLTLPVPGANGPEQVPMQLQLKRLPSLAVDVDVYLPTNMAQRIQNQQQGATIPKPEVKAAPTGDALPDSASNKPKKGPVPKRRGPKL